MVKIISWNVNGLRAIAAKGGLADISRQNPDIVCMQEVRAREDQVGIALPELPHRFICASERPGYAGTSIFSRIEPLSWKPGIGRRVSDAEGRVVTVEFPTFHLLSVYVPNSQRGLLRLGYRLNWDRQFRQFVQELSGRKGVIFCGDMNVAHEEIDIARPNENRMNAGFTDQERASFSRLLGGSRRFVDTFRSLHPEEVRYTWWSYATRARERNIGWRIDYVCVSESLAPRVRESFILDDIMGSDHCPVGITMDGEA